MSGEQIEPIEIETEGKTLEEILEEIILHMQRLGHHKENRVVLGEYVSYLVARKTDGRISILLRLKEFKGADFLLAGADEEYFDRRNKNNWNSRLGVEWLHLA